MPLNTPHGLPPQPTDPPPIDDRQGIREGLQSIVQGGGGILRCGIVYWEGRDMRTRECKRTGYSMIVAEIGA
jgi:hypothetical protein